MDLHSRNSCRLENAGHIIEHLPRHGSYDVPERFRSVFNFPYLSTIEFARAMERGTKN